MQADLRLQNNGLSNPVPQSCKLPAKLMHAALVPTHTVRQSHPGRRTYQSRPALHHSGHSPHSLPERVPRHSLPCRTSATAQSLDQQAES